MLQKVFNADLSYISNEMVKCGYVKPALMRGSMPLQAKANGLQLSDVPPELCGLLWIRAEIDLPACSFHENGSIAIW